MKRSTKKIIIVSTCAKESLLKSDSYPLIVHKVTFKSLQ